MPLQKVAEIRTGIALHKQQVQDPVTLPYMRVANVQDGFLDLREIKYLTLERNKVTRYLLAVGDVLMTEGGDFDKLGRGDVWQGQLAACVHQNHVFAVRPDQQQMLPGYLSALIGSQYGRDFFRHHAKRSTNLASISARQLQNFPVLLPPLAEQQAIVEILQSWDLALTASAELIANSEKQRLAWLDLLLSGQGNLNGTKQTWRHAQISELAWVDPESIKRGTPQDFTFRYICLADVNRGIISSELPTMTLGNAPLRARRVVRPGNILVSMTRPNLQGFAMLGAEHADCIASTGFAVLAAKPGMSQNYLYHYLYSQDIMQQIENVSAGTNYPQLNSAQVGALRIRFPCLSEQQAIAHVLDQADQRILLEKRQREVLLQQKRDLVEQFLSGQHHAALTAYRV